MRKVAVLSLSAVILVSMFAITPIHMTAQSTPNCNPDAVIGMANSLKVSGDKQKDMQSLLDFEQVIHNVNIACNGLKFKGDGNKVLGPFVLPKGTYIVSVSTKNAFIAALQTLSGSDCEGGKTYGLLNEINLEGDKKIESQSTLPVGGDCKVLLSTSNSSASWILTFEPVQ